MLSRECFEIIQKEINVLKHRKAKLFTKEIRSSRAYERMFPRVLSLMNDNERKLVEYVDSFEKLCAETICYNYELNSSKCANDFIVELQNLLSEMENLISKIDWTK